MIFLSYKPSDPVALKAAEPRRATAQLVSGLTRGSPTRGAAPPLRVHSGIRVSPGGIARPRLAQPQRYSPLAASIVSPIDMTATTAAAIATGGSFTNDYTLPTPALRSNAFVLAKLAACAESAVSRLTFAPASTSSGWSHRTAAPALPAAPSSSSRLAAASTTTTTTASTASTTASTGTSTCGSTVSTFTTASDEREAATATTTSVSPLASTASSSSSFTRTASDTASSYDSDEDCEREKEEQGEDDLPLLGASFIGNRGVFVAAGEGSAAPPRWSGMGADRAAEEDGDNNAAA
ncbi:hypothetical protein PLESTF_000916700 [Pleodorina starrii]|nr:hypothetical protein PLESTM_000726500 [Pleodorina starrii]GLC70043.1 hypothetical protein PLESTF_000916700 [Pleodorina starrii]